MIIERRGTRALKAYFAVGVLCHVKKRNGCNSGFMQANGKLVTALSDVRN